MKVANAFAELQAQRHSADYDNAVSWSRDIAMAQIYIARDAFQNWRAINTTPDAEDFLLSLFLPKQPRQ